MTTTKRKSCVTLTPGGQTVSQSTARSLANTGKFLSPEACIINIMIVNIDSRVFILMTQELSE